MFRIGHSMFADTWNALHNVSSSVKGMTDKHFVQDDTETPYVTLFTVKVDDECLRRHVWWWADVVEDFGLGDSNNFAVAEVTDQWSVVMHQNIGGL